MSGKTVLAVWVQPRAARTEIAGRHGGSIKIRVAAPPVDGAANKELIRFLAERLDLPRSAVRVAGGHTGRGKRVVIEGLDARAVSDRLWGPDLTRGRPPE